jgi:hypothetical protein
VTTGTLLDDIIGLGEEATYGTPVTVDRWYPHLDDDESTWDPRLRQGQGLHGGSGRISPLGSRNYPTAGQGAITLKAEIDSKQGGELFRAAFGFSTVTPVTGGSFQLFHPGLTGVYLPCYTIQHVKVRNDGTDYVETYIGCTVSKATIEQPEDDVATIEVEFDALSFATDTAKATPSYATSPVLYDAYNVIGVGLGGTLTVPTTTAFATGLTAVDYFREYKVELDQQIDDEDWRLGAARGRPIAGIPKISFSGKANFDAVTLPNALVAGTKLPWYCTYSTGITDELTTGVSGGMQLVIPQMVLTKDLPKVKAGERRVMDVSANITNNGTDEDIYLAYRTTDVAL